MTTATGQPRFNTTPLTDAEKEFRRRVNSAPMPIWMSNAAGDWFFFNKAWREFTGFDTEESGAKWRELVHPDDRGTLAALFQKHFPARTPYRSQYRLRHHDGAHRWILSHPTPYHDAQDQFAGFISSCFDINEQRELEITLAKRARRQAALAAFGRYALAPRAFADLAREAARTTLSTLEVDCVLLVTLNPATRHLARGALACRLGTNPPSELGPVPPAALAYTRPVLMDDDPENFPLAEHLRAQGIQTALACPIGSGKQLHGYILASTRARRAFSPDATEFLQGIATTLSTINQRDHAEKALAESEQRLLQSQKVEAIGLLAGGLAHDFKNLLTVIRGHTELIEKNFSQLTRAPAAAPLLNTPPVLNIRAHHAGIVNATDRAARLTRQLLAFSRGQTARTERIDLNELITGLKELLAAFLRGGIQLNLALAPAPVFARADRTQIERVILNLAINARDAMPGGGTPTITTEPREISIDDATPALEKGPYAKITVKDTGAGIPPENQPKIFNPFFTTKTPDHGSGLGLPACANIVHNARGSITFETAPGKGATFTVLLPDFAPAHAADTEPLAPPTPLLDAPDTPDDPPADTDLPTGAETLLLVEDDPAIREVTTAILESLGYTVRAFPTGDALLADANTARDAQLLITDLNMPGQSGRQLADRMRALHPALRVLYISGFIADATRPSQGHYLEKPFTRAALAQKIREALE